MTKKKHLNRHATMENTANQIKYAACLHMLRICGISIVQDGVLKAKMIIILNILVF